MSQSGGVTATTSLDGSYRFGNVAPGSYTVAVDVPAGYVPSGQTSSTVNVAIGGAVQANFALQIQGVLGVVYDDLNGNGRQDGGEPGIGGVSITLEDGPTATTSLDGKYRFANAAPDSYVLYLDLPAGYVAFGRPNRLVTVASGGSARANFALQAQSVLQGVVFDDLNGNGAQDVGEAGVGGVTINRDDGPSTTTNGDGSYLFTSVIPGGYALFVGVPAGYVPVGPTSSVVNVASGGSAQANFAVQAQGVIQGVVFDDRNGNSEQDSGEPGVGGVVISQSNGVTATTSVDGGYRFSNVSPGSYTVGIAVPGGFVATGQTSRTVNVGSGGSAQANFALQAQGAIQGVVFDDLNGNNRQDADEAGIGGVTIGRSDGPSVATASDGSYRFSNVTVGSYTLAIDVPAGYVAVGRTSRTVSVAAGGAAQANFALQAQGVIQGLVFDDRNGNGVQDNGETGVGGVTVARGDGPTADTSLDGTYRFTDVVPGAYLLAITVPDSFVAVGQTRRTVNVGSGGSVQSNFTLQARGVIQGVVFDDFNGNGMQDADEAGVGGVVVSQSGGLSTTTSLDGSNRISTVSPISTSLTIAVPAGYVPSGQTSSTVYVGIGGSVQANFALQVQGVLGVVFDDLNGNGRQDSGEPGLGGVNIALEDGPTATTSLDGKYRFANVAEGSYMLYLDLPAGYVSVGRTNRTVNVAAGGSARANFALQAQSVLQGVVFDDLNGNGAQDVGEAGVGGVTITRDDGPDTTTSIDGSYLFTSVVPGGYTLFVGVPAGYVSVGQTSSVVNVASGGSAQANFALQAQGVIQGVVFDDRNGNSEQDSGEPGVGGVVISQSNGVTATTSVDGGYRFSNVTPGSYTLGIAVPAGFVATGQTIRTVNVGSGGSAQVNFALQAQGVIQGVVFDDRSGNGRQDNGEPGVGGVTVTRSGGQQVMTAGDGSYRFNAVAVGSHAVTVTVPAGYLAFGRTSRTVNVAGGSAAQANFILQAQGVIQGVVFDDRNGNGVKDSGEPGVGGVSIARTDGPTTATSLDGSYVFTNVTPGRYTLSISVPAGYIAGSLTTRTLNVASGGSSPANFSLQAQGLIQGVVYEDTDGNGQQDNNEPGIGGVTVTVNPLGAVETKSDGTYRYANVPVGNYSVDVTLPAGYVASTLLTQPVGMPSGGSRVANFGLQVQGLIQGVVFADGNGNGAQDGGEAGVSGVTVKLFNRATEQLVAQRVTSVNGDYRFAALAVAQYRVEIEVPAGYTIPTGSAAVLADLGAASSAVANFALRSPNSISGALFVDQNDNMLRDAGEPGVAGVTIQVQGGASLLNAVTVSDGSYLFSDVPSGIYSVSVGSLAGTGYVLSGIADRLVNLPAGQSGISAVALFTALPDQSLSGVVEPGSDVGLTGGGLVQSSGTAVAVPSVRVNSLGVFQFLNVAPGSYNLVVTPPPGFTAPQQSIPVTFSGGGTRIAKSATRLIANGTIRGVLFEDVDGNQSADSHEKGVGGVQVQLLTGSNLVQQVTAASNGSYQFNNVPTGDYQVNVTAAQFVQTAASAATLTAERPGANLDVSMARQGTIGGRVYRSDIGPAAGLENIALSLSGAAQQSTLTDADGFFHFDGLPAGAYVVALSQLPDVFFPIGGSSQNVDLAAVAGNGTNFALVLRSSVPTALDPVDEPTMVTRLFL
ncbi:MAG: carboxypeptidase regulatory-like domain-containing protein, partial [Caldilinea sp.]|nr:carboxypeptidase regulatory-like domain-containing protein [Caldilinea sp.]